MRAIRYLAMHRSSNGIGSSSEPCVSVSLYSCECLFGQDSPGRPGVERPLPSRVGLKVRVTIYNPGARTRSCIKARIAGQGVVWLDL